MKVNDFILLVLCWNGAGGLADGKLQLGFHAIKPEQIYHADWCKLPYIWTSINAHLILLTSSLCALYA